MLELYLEHITKTFSPTICALDDISLSVRPGECLAVVGPSGCGKTTLLRIIAGLEQPTSGHIHIDGRCADHVPSHRRDVAMLFQRPALIPNGTVRNNLRWAWSLRDPWVFAKRLLGVDQAREAHLLHVAGRLGLINDLDRPVQQLSGGQQQRVALGRCLLRQAKLCLLDEPLGHLDAPLRTELRREIGTLIHESAATLLVVTHDPAEALALGDRVAVVHRGRIVQVGEPAQLLRQPAHQFVAALVHHERGGMNFLRGQLGVHSAGWSFDGPFGRWNFSGSDTSVSATFLRNVNNLLSHHATIHIIIGIAADDVVCSTNPSAREGNIQVAFSVVRQEFSPSGTWVVGRNEQGQMIGRANETESFRPGQNVTMTFSMKQMMGFDPTTGQTTWMPTG